MSSFVFAEDSYVVKYWGKIHSDTSAVSPQRARQMKETLTEKSQLFVNPNDSVVLKNLTNKRLYFYVAKDMKQYGGVKVSSIVSPRILNVLSEMIRQTRTKKPAEVNYELKAAAGRPLGDITKLDPRHVALFNTLAYQSAQLRNGTLPAHADLHFATDTIDSIISCVVENHSKRRSYIINVLVLDTKTGKMDLAINFPAYNKTKTTLVIGPNSRMNLREEVSYELADAESLMFALVVADVKKPYDANYLSDMFADPRIQPNGSSFSNDVILVAN